MSLLCWLKASLQWMQYMYPQVPASLALYGSSTQWIYHLQNLGCNQLFAMWVSTCADCLHHIFRKRRGWISCHTLSTSFSCHRDYVFCSSVLRIQIHCVNKRLLFPVHSLSSVPLAAAFHWGVAEHLSRADIPMLLRRAGKWVCLLHGTAPPQRVAVSYAATLSSNALKTLRPSVWKNASFTLLGMSDGSHRSRTRYSKAIYLI